MATTITDDDDVIIQNDITSELWNGKIPIVVDVVVSEIATLTPPKSLYLFVPRMSYLTVMWKTIADYFENYYPPGSSRKTMWFESQDQQPLKWHLPFGVLYDSICRHNNNHCNNLPWKLTIHFQNYPHHQILPIDDDILNESHYMHSLKQAFCIKYGSPRHIMEMPKALQIQLWTGVSTNSKDIFLQAYQDLVSQDLKLRSIPLRILVPDQPLVQLPISAEKTLEQVMEYFFTHYHRHHHHHHECMEKEVAIVVKIQGIVIQDHSTITLDSLYRLFAHPDGFLYLNL